MELASLNFLVGSSGSTHLSDPAKLDPSGIEVKTIAMSGSSVGSSSEVNSPVSYTIAENTGEKIKELDETMEKLDIGETVDQSLPKRTSSPEAVASPAIYTTYASSSQKQQKTTNLQTMQQPTYKSTNQGVTAKGKKRKFMFPPESGESSCRRSTMAQRYPPIQEGKS
jgi:hypothetical protein